MRISVAEAAQAIESRGLLKRHRHDQYPRVIGYARSQLGRELPSDLADFYAERIESIGEFKAIYPVWNEWVGWRKADGEVTRLLHADAVPLFWDGCGDIFGLDLASGDSTPAVYFFDHDHEFAKPEWAAGSSLGAFLLLLADQDRAYVEGWPMGWQLKIDPDLDRCPRARAIWNAG